MLKEETQKCLVIKEKVVDVSKFSNIANIIISNSWKLWSQTFRLENKIDF